MNTTNQKKEDNKFLLCLSVFAFIVFVKYMPDNLPPEMNKEFIVGYILSVLVLLLFYKSALMKIKETQNKTLRYLIVFLSVFTFSSPLTAERAGGADNMQIVLLCMCLILMLFEKAEWLVAPLSATAMIIGADYIFLYGNIVIALLIYKYVTKEKSQQKKYLIMALLTAGVDIVLFFGLKGWRIFGDLVWFCNFRRMGVFLICFLPYLVMAGFFLKGVLQKAEKKAPYLILCLCGLAGIPMLLLKNQGGRWLSSIILFGAAVYTILLALNDEAVTNQTETLKEKMRESGPIAIMMLAYPILFVPLNDAVICRTADWIVRLLIG